MDSLFFKSVLMQPPRIMGVKLRPFSCYHALVMMQFDSPFLMDGSVDAGDIAAALCIMSEGYDDDLRRLMRLENSFIYRSYWFVKLFFCSRKTLERVTAEIRAHIRGYSDVPELRSGWADKSSKSDASGVPWPFRVAATVWKNFKCSESAAWDMALSKAACFRACHAEDCGMTVKSEAGIEGAWHRWQNSPDCEKYETLEEFLEAERINNGRN